MNKKIMLFLIFILSALIVFSSCGSKKVNVQLKLDKADINLEVGASENLSFTISPAGPSSPAVEWISDNVNVVMVDAGGTVTAVSPGKAEITIKTKDGSSSAICNITVNAKTVKGISLNKDTVSIETGSTLKLEASIYPEGAENKKIVWESSDAKLATVDQSGNVTTISAGTVYITAKTEDGNFTTKCTITITAKTTGTANTQTNQSNPTPTPKPQAQTPATGWKESISGENSLNNNANDNFFTRVGDWLYYNSTPESGIFKIKIDGTSKTKLRSVSTSHMLVNGNYIYYENSNDKGAVYRMTLSGGDVKKVSTFFSPTEGCSSLNIYNGYLFYEDNLQSVQRIKLDLSKGDIIPMQPTRPRYMYIWGNMMYYTNMLENDCIYTMNLDSQEKKQFCGSSASCMNLYNNELYFTNTDNGKKISKVVGGTAKTIGSDQALGMNIYGGWIYYTNASDGNKLYKIKTDGTGKSKVSDDSAFHINIVGSWIFYQTYGAKEIYVIKNDGSIKYKL